MFRGSKMRDSCSTNTSELARMARAQQMIEILLWSSGADTAFAGNRVDFESNSVVSCHNSYICNQFKKVWAKPRGKKSKEKL